MGVVKTQVMALIGDHTRANRQGRVLGALYTVGDLGSAAGPPIAYALMPWIELEGVYLLCGGLFAIGILLAALSQRTVP